MKYAQLKLKPEYRDKLKALADNKNRSMARQLEVVIDAAVEADRFKAVLRAFTRGIRRAASAFVDHDL